MKITFIGAGSLVFARNLIRDILTFPALRKDLTICLEDINPHRLELITAFTDKLRQENAELLTTVKFEATTDQRAAITGARYIICAVQVGGMKSYGNDVKIAHKYGVHQVIGDTLGPGGVFRFLRTVPVYNSVLKDIKEVGEYREGRPPIFINYTNPMVMNTWYCNTVLPDSTVGLCHGVQGTSQQLRNWLEVEPENFRFECAGINHMAWFIKVEYKQPERAAEDESAWKDGYPRIKENLRKNRKLGHREKIRIDMMHATGYYMTESSGHLSEYLPYYLKRADLRLKYGSAIGRGFSTLKQGIDYKNQRVRARFMDQEFKHLLKKSMVLPDKASSEYASSIINASETGIPFEFNGNILQRDGSLITNLPKESCVEVPISVDDTGFHPQKGFELPPVCQGLNMSNLMVQQAAVKGALTKNKELIYHAILLDPNTASSCSPKEVRKMVDKMFEANREWLGYFEE